MPRRGRVRSSAYRGKPMRLRDFITLRGGAAASPLAARLTVSGFPRGGTLRANSSTPEQWAATIPAGISLTQSSDWPATTAEGRRLSLRVDASGRGTGMGDLVFRWTGIFQNHAVYLACQHTQPGIYAETICLRKLGRGKLVEDRRLLIAADRYCSQIDGQLFHVGCSSGRWTVECANSRI